LQFRPIRGFLTFSPVERMDRISIAAKLPIGIAGLLALVSGSLTVLSHAQVRSLVAQSASERLAQAAGEVSRLLSTSAHQRLAALATLSEARASSRLITAPAAEPLEPPEAWWAYLGGLPDAAALELLDVAGRRLLTAGAPFEEISVADRSALANTLSDSQAHVSPYARDETGQVSYWVGAPVVRGGRTLGYLVERRRVTSSAAAVGLLIGLVGTDAKMLVGNAKGDVWIDLADPAADIPLGAVPPDELAQYTPAGGEPAFVRAAAIDGAPWLVAIALPEAPILAPARRFLVAGLAGSAVVVAVGGIVGWAVSREITKPLVQLTEAAEAIVASGSAAHVAVGRRDEIGRLAQSFNVMSDEVREGRERLEALVADLEHRVSRRTADLESANRDLEAFSYSVSHDLRAPLRAIHGFSRILLDDHASKLPSEVQRYLHLVAENTTRMGQLIDDLLTFSRLGRQAIRLQPVEPADVVRRALEELHTERNGRRLDVRIGDLPACTADPALLKQVYVNLLSNAIKFTRRRDDAAIEIGALSPDGSPSPTYFVRDNGTGFDMQYAHKLFGVFQRLHSAEEFEGTGVGLVMVHRIVSRHGGRVWADAAPGQGATFYFTLGEGSLE
jgi:signal transduction histidine kinase